MRPIKENRPSGITCPECNNFIPLSIHTLLSSGCFSCPCCGLTLSVDQKSSEVAINALSKLYNGQRNFDPNPKYNL